MLHLMVLVVWERSWGGLRCAWMAATLKDSAADHGEASLAFAMVAGDLAHDEALPDLPLFYIIAEATVDAFAASTLRLRGPGRRGR